MKRQILRIALACLTALALTGVADAGMTKQVRKARSKDGSSDDPLFQTTATGATLSND